MKITQHYLIILILIIQTNHLNIENQQHMKDQTIYRFQTTNDDVDVLKSRIDSIELMLETQNELISDIEASVKRCIYHFFANCDEYTCFLYVYFLYNI